MAHDFLIWAAQFNIALIGLALLVCAAGSFTVFALLGRALAAGSAVRWVWLAGVCIGFGAAVWATHFVAMLAYDPKTPFTYRLGPTALSIAIAIAGSAPPFAAVIIRPRARGVWAGAGLMLGLVIGAMHFVGMSAMRMAMPAAQNPVYAVAACAAGMVLCMFAMLAAMRRDLPHGTSIATLFLILAICTLHFTAMGGYVPAMPVAMLHPGAAALPDGAAAGSSLWLAFTVAGVSLLILLSAFNAAMTDVKFDALRQREAAALNHVARHDELTSLPNRLYLRERLTQAMAEPPEMRNFALFYIDLDRFKPINDLYGHHAGDLVLAEIAERIQGLVRASDMAARFGGDEFIILQRGSATPAQAVPLAERLVSRLAEPVLLDGGAVQVGASVGIAFYPAQANGLDEVIRNADMALYTAKMEGGGFRFFTTEMSELLLFQRTLQQDLLVALEQEQFELFYQPIFACDTGRLVWFEALIRWRHPVRGMIPPAEFIAYAEKSMLIVKLGLWVLKTACREAAYWPDEIGVAVNLSPKQLCREDLAQTILNAIEVTGLDPSRLELEVTENALIDTPEQARATMTCLKRRGVRFAIDDFGTGYSSLSSLHSFPFDRVKIDRSFVQGMEADASLAAIVRAIVSLGKSLDIGVVAEGVETAEQLALLRKQDCGHVQGFLLGRPVPAAEVAALIAADQPQTAALPPERAVRTEPAPSAV